jgi:hypothetical protein
VQWAAAPQLPSCALGTIACFFAGGLASGGFHPSYDQPACGPGGACPSGLQCSTQGICDLPGTSATDIDRRTAGRCPDGECRLLWAERLAGMPGGGCQRQISLPGAIDTDKSSLCLAAQPASWTATQPAACIIAGDTVTVGSAGVTGSRPLVLVAQTRITVSGLLDAASHRGFNLHHRALRNARAPDGSTYKWHILLARFPGSLPCPGRASYGQLK